MATLSVVPPPSGGGTGYVTWNTGSPTTFGAVWEKIDSNSEQQIDPPVGSLASSGNGIQFLLSAGQTAVFTLKDQDQIPLAPSVTVTVAGSGGGGPLDLGGFKSKAQDGLNLIHQIGDFQIVSGVTVVAGPTSVRIKFTTAFPTIPLVEIFTKTSKHPSVDMVVANRVAQSFPLFDGNQTSHQSKLTGLDQDTAFWYRITADGGPIKSPSVVTDHFVTGRRRATVFVDEIKVFNSGDPGGTGEMNFQFGVYDLDNETLLGTEHDLPNQGKQEIESGNSITSPFGNPVEVIDKAPANVGLYIQGQDYDPSWRLMEPFGTTTDLPLDSLPGTGHGEDNIHVWATLLLPVELPDFAKTIQFDANPGNFGVHYTALGKINVEIFLPKNVYETPSVISPDRVTHMGKWLWIGDIKTGVQSLTLGPDGNVWRRVDNRGVRRPRRPTWKAIGGPRFPEGFTVVSSPRGRADLFGRAANDRVARATWNLKGEDERIEWSDLGGQIISGITVVRSKDALNLFAIGKNGAAVHARIDNNQKTNRETKWQSLGGKFRGHLAAVASSTGGFHLFGTNENGAGFHKLLSRDGRSAGAGKWTPLGGEFATSVVAQPTSRGVDAFGVDNHRTLFGKSWDGRKWNPAGTKWLQLGSLDSFSVPRRVKSGPAKKARKKK